MNENRLMEAITNNLQIPEIVQRFGWKWKKVFLRARKKQLRNMQTEKELLAETYIRKYLQEHQCWNAMIQSPQIDQYCKK